MMTEKEITEAANQVEQEWKEAEAEFETWGKSNFFPSKESGDVKERFRQQKKTLEMKGPQLSSVLRAIQGRHPDCDATMRERLVKAALSRAQARRNAAGQAKAVAEDDSIQRMQKIRDACRGNATAALNAFIADMSPADVALVYAANDQPPTPTKEPEHPLDKLRGYRPAVTIAPTNRQTINHNRRTTMSDDNADNPATKIRMYSGGAKFNTPRGPSGTFSMADYRAFREQAEAELDQMPGTASLSKQQREARIERRIQELIKGDGNAN